ncbi:MAG: cytidine deaminase [Chloroflexota bacterium]
MNVTNVTQEQMALIEAATAARERAYAPYSGFQVGAAVLAGGRIFQGCNVENTSYGLAICAERAAVFAAVAAGERRIDAVAVVADTTSPTTPCGACRQVLSEFGRDVVVICATVTGETAIHALADLLPHAFYLEGPSQAV